MTPWTFCILIRLKHLSIVYTKLKEFPDLLLGGELIDAQPLHLYNVDSLLDLQVLIQNISIFIDYGLLQQVDDFVVVNF